MPKTPKTQTNPTRQGMHIALPFDKAVEGLLAVKPKKAEKPKKKPVKK